MTKLEGKIAVVAGATRGVGRGVGRAVAALASDPNVMLKSGHALVAAALAQEYGFTDVDGKRPRPLTLEDV